MSYIIRFKSLVFLLGMVFWSSASFAQLPLIIQLPDFYDGNGVVFLDSSNVEQVLDEKDRFTNITKDDIKKAEGILQNDIKNHYKRRMEYYLDKRSLSNKEIRQWKKTIKKASMKKYEKYNRQYYGFLKGNGQKVVFIRLINYSKSPTMFSYWDKEIMIGFGLFYEENTHIFYINLDEQRID